MQRLGNSIAAFHFYIYDFKFYILHSFGRPSKKHPGNLY